MSRIDDLLNPRSVSPRLAAKGAASISNAVSEAESNGTHECFNFDQAFIPGPSSSRMSSSSSQSFSPTAVVNIASHLHPHNLAHDVNHRPHASCPNSLSCLEDTVGRPQYTYPVIMRSAILGSPMKRLTIREMYATIEAKFPYYRDAGDTWKQSIRHYLSLSRTFERKPRPIMEPGQGSYWTVNLDAPPGTKRPRKRGRPDRAHVSENQNPRKRGRPRKNREIPEPPPPVMEEDELGGDILQDGAPQPASHPRWWAENDPQPSPQQEPAALLSESAPWQHASSSYPAVDRDEMPTILPPLRAVSFEDDISSDDFDETDECSNYFTTQRECSLSTAPSDYGVPQKSAIFGQYGNPSDHLRAQLDELRQSADAERQSLLTQLAEARAHAQFAESQLMQEIGKRRKKPQPLRWRIVEYVPKPRSDS